MKQDWSGSGLPPVGTVCMFNSYDGTSMEGEITHILKSGKAAIIEYYEGFDIGTEEKFSPIRTDRDRWIEAAVKALRPTMGRFAEEECGIIGMIYDAGLAKLPNEEKGNDVCSQ